MSCTFINVHSSIWIYIFPQFIQQFWNAFSCLHRHLLLHLRIIHRLPKVYFLSSIEFSLHFLFPEVYFFILQLSWIGNTLSKSVIVFINLITLLINFRCATVQKKATSNFVIAFFKFLIIVFFQIVVFRRFVYSLFISVTFCSYLYFMFTFLEYCSLFIIVIKCFSFLKIEWIKIIAFN